jgi:hypothetical protein
MIVSGEAAKNFRVVRLDSMEDAFKGELVSADDVTGEVIYHDTPETTKTLSLGSGAIVILSKTYR